MADARNLGDGEAVRRFESGGRVAVLLPLPLAGPYDYRVPPDLAVAAGDFVEAPLGGRALAAFEMPSGLAAAAIADIRHGLQFTG